MGTDLDKLGKRAVKAKVSTMQRHVLVCTSGDCKPGKDVVKRIKRGIALAGLRAQVSTAKTKCMDICKGKGAIVVVYPDGTWYGGVDEDLADRIVAEHLVGGRPVAEAVFLHNPLTTG
ncbi:ferredoxin [Euzebya sp.]|uniref:(2Fe-2S) ferredoxin domain-containing protein n=1 Tax=Euzebya sp. TaxID=1971409 RepID=UPI003514CA5B